jgi:hypothetical protein
MNVKIIILTTAFLLIAKLSFCQTNFYLQDIYEKIDSVQLTQDENKYQLVLIAGDLESTSRTWTSMASQLCIYHLQQMELIPLRSQDMLLAILYSPVSDFSSPESNKDVTFLQPEIRQFDFVLLPIYRSLCEYSINNFTPLDIKQFEEIVSKKILDKNEFDYQRLLFEIARTNQQNPDKDVANEIHLIKTFFKENENLNSKISDYIAEQYNEQLELEELEIEDLVPDELEIKIGE